MDLLIKVDHIYSSIINRLADNPLHLQLSLDPDLSFAVRMPASHLKGAQ
jgi:hypothetical protein